MNLGKIILKELLERKKQFITSFIAILLGIIVIVAVKSVSNSSEKAVAIQLDNLGANILVLPQTTTIDNYYAADINAPEMPEEYVERIASSTIQGVDNMSPKLSARIFVEDYSLVLTGILPKNELASKPIWQTVGFSDPGLMAACDPNNIVNRSHGFEDPRLQRKSIDSLGVNDCLIGSDVASQLDVDKDSGIQIRGTKLKVAEILPQTGTVDDGRIFVHLHTAQKILGKEKVINAIEIMGCCSAITEGLLGNLRNILPDTKITTINHIVQTQVETNETMAKFSIIFLIIIILVGGISIGNYMWSNVEERKKEIGSLLAIGASPGDIYYIFIGKALILGLIGGVAGYVFGSLAGMILGPQIAGVKVLPIPILFIWSMLLAVGISILASYLPARKAAKMDPALILQET
ncbi:MAG: ABC transporter permease [Gemmatimonadota bacterium]|nr:MAG: ABC transporter permease [Gemmatimonadota bacterium]